MGYKATTRLLINKGAVITTKDNYRYIAYDIAKETGLDYVIKALNSKETGFIIYKGCIIQF